jgi:fatty-acid desaturase
VGWLFDHTQRGSRERFAPDLLADPVINFVDKTFVLWSLVGLAIPFGLGVLIGGTVAAGLEAMLWAGAVRIFVLHHVTYSINSLCHFFGRRRFATERPLAQPAVAGAAVVRRGLAQQPPRLSHLGRSMDWAAGRSTSRAS